MSPQHNSQACDFGELRTIDALESAVVSAAPRGNGNGQLGALIRRPCTGSGTQPIVLNASVRCG